MGKAADNQGKIRKKLLAAASALNQGEQWVLQLLAVAGMPLEQEDIARCMGRCSRNARDLARVLARLLKSELACRTEQRLECNPLLREPLTREALSAGGFHTMAGAVREVVWRGAGWSEREVRNYGQAVARLRLALYQRNAADCQQIMQHVQRLFPAEYEQQHPYALIADTPFDPRWLSTLPPRLMLEILLAILNQSLRNLEPAEEAFEALRAFCRANPDTPAGMYLVPQWIYRGKLAKARKVLKELDEESGLALRGWLETVSGDTATAAELFTRATSGKQKVLPPLINIFYVLALLKEGIDEEAALLVAQENKRGRNPYSDAFDMLGWLLMRRDNTFSAPLPLPDPDAPPLVHLLHFLIACWEEGELARRLSPQMEAFYSAAAEGGYDWLAGQTAGILAQLETDAQTEWAGRLAVINKRSKSFPLCTLFTVRAGWERPLRALAEIPQQIAQERDSGQESRLSWLISYNDAAAICELQPVEQRRNADGNWGRGRKLAWQRLFQEWQALDYLDPQDREICAAIVPASYGAGRGARLEYELDYAKALPALVGHPRVFRTDFPEIRVEITSGEPELLAIQSDNTLHIRLEPEIDEDSPVAVRREGQARLRVIKAGTAHRRISAIIGPRGLRVPAAAFEEAGKVIERLSHLVTVQSDIGISQTLAEDVVADGRLRVHLMPSGAGMKIEMLVQPFGEAGGYYRPGAGAQTIVADIGGKRLRTTRTLAHELAQEDMILQGCPALRTAAENEGIRQLEDIVDCLEFLLQLEEFADRVVVEWPQGGRLRVRGQAGMSNLGLRIKSSGDWFSLEGELRVDEDMVLDMRRLLEVTRHTKGRFIPLGKDTYLALTDAFRQRLEEIRDYSESAGEGMRLHPLAALALEDIAAEAGDFKADAEWRKVAGRIRATGDAPVPPTLLTDLRGYQLEGFCWLARLAEWGMGACLADDMGLGKTIQSLALLLHRARSGPALVIAPTSVCFNWLSEAARFAPSLQLSLFGQGEREATIRDAGPFSVVVCSYAMLQYEAELIGSCRWHTVILDEAQAIKNAATKRSKAAMNLNADFRMITTGTPLENHLGELWNLFQFLNPGLLGSLRRFNQRFAQPIEKDNDERARQRLKKLLAPFILRRMKTQVLEELPPRTEIVKHIQMSPRELAFYEALRREAVQELQKSREAGPGEQRLRILAQIMRLRRACCNPKLIDHASTVESSKLEEFGEIAGELLENGHKALVFSQFVDHLEILRRHLDGRGISYKYLDGSTPANKRKKLVEEFQAGEADFFLISLKAGGQGLNLTAADYVIHMDPWWNPAVEDQASDRAHRIGQTRPVTIYRMITAGTIEDKIVELHKRKRGLAESLLEDTGHGGNVSVDELLALLRED